MKPTPFVALLGLFSIMVTGCARIITSGNYTLKQGNTLSGSLLVTSGRITLEEGARVTGSVYMTSGNLTVDGEVKGNVLMTSGHVEVGPKALIRGSIKGTSGSVRQAEGSHIMGDVSTDSSSFTTEGLGKFLLAIGSVLYFLVTGRSRSDDDDEKALSQKEPSAEELEFLANEPSEWKKNNH